MNAGFLSQYRIGKNCQKDMIAHQSKYFNKEPFSVIPFLQERKNGMNNTIFEKIACKISCHVV